jgi:hypothetical protein
MFVQITLFTACIVTIFTIKIFGEFWRVFVIHLYPKYRKEKIGNIFPKKKYAHNLKCKKTENESIMLRKRFLGDPFQDFCRIFNFGHF